MNHPCGNTPVSGAYVSVWHCHYHQAWFFLVQASYQDGDAAEFLVDRYHEFGPFDDEADVLEAAHRELTAAIELARSPRGTRDDRRASSSPS